MEYRTVFDVAAAGFKDWSFSAHGLIFVVIGAVAVALRKRLPGWWRSQPRASNVFAFVFLGFAIIWTVTAFVATYGQHSRLVNVANTGRAQVVEGPVTNFKPMPKGGHSLERFCVQSKCFEYSDWIITGAFNWSNAKGGPIREGLPVRVTYSGKDILKLEVGQ